MNGTAHHRSKLTRERLLTAAVEAFSERGFHGTTTREIAAASGLSSAALYVHHRTKEDLLYEISKAGHEETLAIVRAAAAGSENPAERLRAVVRAYVLFHARRHTMARVINYELAALADDHQGDIRAIRRKIDNEIHSIVKAGVASGDFNTRDTRMTALAIESLGIDVARWWREVGTWTPDLVAERYVDMALRLVGCHTA